MITFCKKVHHFGHPRLGKQFVHPYWPVDPRVGCSNSFDLVGACKAKSNLLKELHVEFWGDQAGRIPKSCDFPNWFQFVALSVPCSRLDLHTMEIFCLQFWATNFFYHNCVLSLTLDYGYHSCKVYVGLAKEKSLNCICYFLVLLLKIQTSNLQASDIIWFLKLETCKKIGFFHELSDEYVILENQLWTGLKTRVKSIKSPWPPD